MKIGKGHKCFCKMRISYIFFTFYLLCLSETIQRNEVLTQEWQDFPSMVFNDLSQDQQTYIILFLTHLVVALWILICIFGTDIYWSPRSSLQDNQVNQDHRCNESHTMNAVKMHATSEQLDNDNEEVNAADATEHIDNDNEELNAAELLVTEQQLDNDEDELNDSYLSILVDCIRVMISQAANEQEARNIIRQALAEEFPNYFHNDKVINCFLELNTSIGNGILLESKVNEADGEQNEEKHPLLVEDVVASQEEDHEYISAITDEELISMISDILANSCEEDDSGTPWSPLEDHDALNIPIRRLVPPVNKGEENLEFKQGAKIDDTNENESVEMSFSIPLLDQMHFLPDDIEDSCLASTDHERDSLYPLSKEDLDGSLSWSSLPGESRVPSENEFHHDADAFCTAPRYAFSKPSCVITTASSCPSCKDAEHDLQNIELTPTHVLPTAARLSLSGSLQGSFSEVLSKLTHAKRSSYKRRTATARELWSDSQEDDTSIFNASFSISSLEGMLSPESIPPSPSSPIFGSPEKSPHVLGIRLHKPAGFKDVFLSVVDHDKKTGLPRNISNTWTLGTREEMELILHVDTNPHQRATKTYSGRYCLAFNDKSDLEEYLSNQDSQEDFGFSMLCSHDNSREERVSASDEECYESFLSYSNVDGVCCEEDQEIVMEISQANDLEDEKELSRDHIDKEEKHQKEDELPKTEKSDHGDIKPVGYKGAGEKRQEEELSQDEKSDQDQKCSAEEPHCSPRDKERIFAFACLALTSYLAHRYLQ